MKYGYARVSSDTRDYAGQVEALKAAGCDKIYAEKASGGSRHGRPDLAKLMKALLPGDVMIVAKLDRVARSARDLLNIVGELREQGCGFVSLGDTWCDTTTDAGKLMMTIMAGIAEFECSLTRARCQAGIARAKANGKQFGRRPVLDAGQRKRIAERYTAGETMVQLARESDCGVATIHRAIGG